MYYISTCNGYTTIAYYGSLVSLTIVHNTVKKVNCKEYEYARI